MTSFGRVVLICFRRLSENSSGTLNADGRSIVPLSRSHRQNAAAFDVSLFLTNTLWQSLSKLLLVQTFFRLLSNANIFWTHKKKTTTIKWKQNKNIYPTTNIYYHSLVHGIVKNPKGVFVCTLTDTCQSAGNLLLTNIVPFTCSEPGTSTVLG